MRKGHGRKTLLKACDQTSLSQNLSCTVSLVDVIIRAQGHFGKPLSITTFCRCFYKCNLRLKGAIYQYCLEVPKTSLGLVSSDINILYSLLKKQQLCSLDQRVKGPYKLLSALGPKASIRHVGELCQCPQHCVPKMNFFSFTIFILDIPEKPRCQTSLSAVVSCLQLQMCSALWSKDPMHFLYS